jgi:Ca2+-binding RTX toxin-like protein
MFEISETDSCAPDVMDAHSFKLLGGLKPKAVVRVRVLSRALLVVGTVASFVVSGVGVVQAAPTITFDGSPGTGPPPATLGPYVMTPFGLDPRPLFVNVNDVPGPTGPVTFNHPLDHRRIGSGWATWSHGYTGDVYFDPGQSVVLTLPPGTVAFYFYAEPNVFSVFNITATAQDGTTSGPIPVSGSAGARYFGFYTTDTTIATITITVQAGSLGFAIGEFGIASLLALCAAPPAPAPGDIVGTPGDDMLPGTPGNDRIFGLGGNDQIAGLGGNDVIFAGAGDDRISAGDGNDIVCGGPGNDQITGGNGDDLLSGDEGNDRILGDAGADTLFGGPGNDILDGGAGTNTNDGGPDVDTCLNPSPGVNCSP